MSAATRAAPRRNRRGAGKPDLTADRPTVWGLAREFNPDRRWFHPYLVALWLYVLAAVPVWSGLPAWSLIPVGLVGTVLGWFGARRRYPVELYGRAQRRQALWLTFTAGLAVTVWLYRAGEMRPTNLLSLGLLVLGALVFGGAYALIKTQAPTRKAQVEQARAEAQAQREAAVEQAADRRERSEWEQILDDAKLPLTVLERTPTKAGYTLRLGNPPTSGITFNDLRDGCERIANAASHRLGLRVSREQIRPEETDSAAEFLLHVSTTNYLATSLAYPLDRPVRSIVPPILPGVYEDGADIEIGMFGVHTVMVSGTGGGKTVFTNNVIAECTRCCDAVVWIAASDKLIPLIYPWLFPWFAGMTRRPVLDRVAGEQPLQVLGMLADVYQFAKLRNKRLGPNSKFVPSPGDPALVAIIEEASDLLIDNEKLAIRTFDGKKMNGSQLINAITRMARSAGVSLYLLTQYGLMDALGAHGNFAKRNITQRIAGKTYSAYDGSSTLVGMNVDTTKLRNHTVLVQPSADEPRVLPGKAYELDGVDQIAPIAARNTANVPRLPRWLVVELGSGYAERWNPENLPELAEVMRAQGMAWPSLAEVNAGGVDDTFTELIQNALPAGRGEPQQDAGGTVDDRNRDTGTPPTDEEIDAMQKTADEKMDHAIEDIRKWGSLGETMTKIADVIRADNAPAFVPANLLAHVIGRVDTDGDWDAAGRKLIEELAGNPWQLETITRNGEAGWERATLLERIKTYLSGVTEAIGSAPADAPEPEPALAEPMASIIAALAGRPDTDDVTTGELTVLSGRVSADAAEMDRRRAAVRLGRELGAPPWNLQATRTRNGSVYRVSELREAAAGAQATQAN